MPIRHPWLGWWHTGPPSSSQLDSRRRCLTRIRVKASKALIATRVYLFNNRSPLYLMKGSGDTHSPGVRLYVYTWKKSSKLQLYWTVTAECRLSTVASDFVTSFHPDGRIILPCSTFALEKWTLCCNCDFVYMPTVLRLQQKSDPAKSGSGRILGFGYPNPVSGRKSISVHPYYTVSQKNWIPLTSSNMLKSNTSKYQCPMQRIFM